MADPAGLRVTSTTVCVVADTVVLVHELESGPPAVTVMSAREAHHLRSRMHKAANDAGAAAARKRAAA